MKKILLKGIIAGFVLLVISYAALFGLIRLFPSLAEQYYDPMFNFDDSKVWLYFAHPFVLSFALAIFWSRFKSLFHGPSWWRGIELGLIYGLIATLPSMWMIFSAMNVSLSLVLSWLVYGVFQAAVVGILFAKISP